MLMSLPNELLTSIAVRLGLRDLLLLRRVYRLLHSISASDLVWRQRFAHSLGVTIPEPFFLPRSLDSCSARDIETALKKYTEDWQQSSPAQYFVRPVLWVQSDTWPILHGTAVVVPGGRWILFAHANASIWYLDLGEDLTSTEQLEPQLLVPSPFPDHLNPEDHCIEVQLTADFSSDVSLGTSLEDCTVLQFNIAVVICAEVWLVSHPTQVDVWRIHVCKESNEGSLKLRDNLSSFREDGRAYLLNASLYGQSVGYSLSIAAMDFVLIIDWADAHGKGPSEGILRSRSDGYSTSVLDDASTAWEPNLDNG
ncbi:hypothetical protein NMY22_g10786 [Coprinellus aureogranulatus]|nr:hypothetical protein NMY22_g10786 [Coprinellus aureogranulatus]